jgi:sugar lactone lactonase YvrE
VSQARSILSPSAESSPFVSHDPEFGAVLGDAPRLARVLKTDAHEGPVYAAEEDALYFRTLPRPGSVPAPGVPSVVIKRIALDGDRFPLEPERVSTVRPDASVANGMALDLEGRLVVCEQEGGLVGEFAGQGGRPGPRLELEALEGRPKRALRRPRTTIS